MKTLFSLLFVFNLVNLNAAIVYTDVDPDQEFTVTDVFMINAVDGMRVDVDFSIPSFRTDVVPGSTLKFATPNSGDLNILTYNLNESIDGSSVYYSQLSDINPGSNYFVGFQFTTAGNTHYGWMKLTSTIGAGTSGKVTILEYAYEDTPNTSIGAGNTGLTSGLDHLGTSKLILCPTLTSSKLNISNLDSSEIEEISAFNLSGGNNSAFRLVDDCVDVSNLPKGRFILIVKTRSGRLLRGNFIKEGAQY